MRLGTPIAPGVPRFSRFDGIVESKPNSHKTFRSRKFAIRQSGRKSIMGRVRIGLFASACLMLCRAGWGQGYPMPGHPAAVAPGLFPAAAAANPAIPPEVQFDPSITPAGWHHHAPANYSQDGLSPDVMHQLLPQDPGFLYDHDSRLDLVVHEWMRGSWVSMEYLNWNVSKRGKTILGSQTTLTPNPTFAFDVPVFDNDPTLNPVLPGRAAHTGGTDWTDINGIKGSFGIPVTQSTWLEGSFFGLEQITDELHFDTLPASITVRNPNPIQVIVVPLLTNGVPGTRLVVYDADFDASYSTQVWSADANLVFNNSDPDQGISFQSIVGFKHLELNERLSFGGSYTNVSGYNQVLGAVIPARTNRLDSYADNYIYGGQFGFRSEFRHQYFTLGAEPKVIFASNFTRSNVNTQNFREPGDVTNALDDGTTRASASDNRFTPGFDLSVYAKVHLTEWFNFKIGYNFLWLDRLNTADRNVQYNDTGDLNPPAIGVQRTYADRYLDGLSIGGEILLP